MYVKNLCEGVSNVRWAPRHRHTLVFGVTDVYGNARLAMWNGGKRAITLVPRKYKYDTISEYFELDGISGDGRTVYYAYSNDNPHGSQYEDWHSYNIKLEVGSKPHKSNRKYASMPEVWDKSVILTGN
jgi:hypothetical protein